MEPIPIMMPLSARVKHDGRAMTTDDLSRFSTSSASSVGDLESNGMSRDRDPNTIVLFSLVKKAFEMLDAINRAICAETMEIVVKNKPIFDKQKLILISMHNFTTSYLDAGTLVYIKTRTVYRGEYLSEGTFSKEWNDKAKIINAQMSGINSGINSDINSVLGDSDCRALSTAVPRKYRCALYAVLFLAFIGLPTFMGFVIYEIRGVGRSGSVDVGQMEQSVTPQVKSAPDATVKFMSAQPKQLDATFEMMDFDVGFKYISQKKRKGDVYYQNGQLNYQGEYLVATGGKAEEMYKDAELRPTNGEY